MPALPAGAEAPAPRPCSTPAALLLALSAPAARAADGAAVGATLESLLELARNRSPELRAMQLEAQAASHRIGPAGALPDPMFSTELRDVTNEATDGSFNLLPARVGSARYQWRQTFPAWGQRGAKREAAQALADEAGHRASATWADLAMRVKTAFARWQQVHAALDQTREILALTTRLEAVAQARYASGLAPQQDAIRAQVERTAIQAELARLEAERATLQARINGLLARAADSPLAPPRADAPLPPLPPPAALAERLRQRSPLLAAEEARVRAADRNKDVVWSNRYPEFSVGVAPVQMRNRISEWELMFEVSVPLWRERRRADEREALAMLEAARARRQAAADELQAQLGEQIAALDAARRIESLTRTSLLPQTELNLQAALAGYETGGVDFAAVLDAQRQMRQAQLELIATRAEARMRQAEIERLLGDEL
jgi:outer membrane protein TolC